MPKIKKNSVPVRHSARKCRAPKLFVEDEELEQIPISPKKTLKNKPKAKRSVTLTECMCCNFK